MLNDRDRCSWGKSALQTVLLHRLPQMRLLECVRMKRGEIPCSMLCVQQAYA
jgi:hypothetical protein